MTCENSISLIIAALALLLSIVSFVVACLRYKDKTQASYRVFFFEKFIKNDFLYNLAKLVSLLKTANQNDKENLEQIHKSVHDYLEIIKPLLYFDEKTYKIFHDHLIKIDDSSVLSLQRIKDKADYSDKVKEICSTTTTFFKELKKYYCGK